LKSDSTANPLGLYQEWCEIIRYSFLSFLDLVFTNVFVNMAVEGTGAPLLKLDRHLKAYEIEMQICC
jgi:hypothetical protein